MADYTDTTYDSVAAIGTLNGSFSQLANTAAFAYNAYTSAINANVYAQQINGLSGGLSGLSQGLMPEKDPVDVLAQAIIEPVLSNEIFIMTDVTRELTKHCGHIFTEDIVAIYKPKHQVDHSDVVIIDGNDDQLVLNSDYLFNGEWLCFKKEVAYPLEMAYKIRAITYPNAWQVAEPNYPGQYIPTIQTTPSFGTTNPPPNYWYQSGNPTVGGQGTIISGTTTTKTVI